MRVHYAALADISGKNKHHGKDDSGSYLHIMHRSVEDFFPVTQHFSHSAIQYRQNQTFRKQDIMRKPMHRRMRLLQAERVVKSERKRSGIIEADAFLAMELSKCKTIEPPKKEHYRIASLFSCSVLLVSLLRADPSPDPFLDTAGLSTVGVEVWLP